MLRGMGGGGGQTGPGPGEGQLGAMTSPTTGHSQGHVPSLKEERNRKEDIFLERGFLHGGMCRQGLGGSAFILLPGKQVSGDSLDLVGQGRGSHTLEPRLLPSREPGAQREGTAYSGHVRDSATGSGRAALCQYPGLQGLVAAGGGGALLQPLGTWLSQMPQPGSVSGTCVRAFYISIKS